MVIYGMGEEGLLFHCFDSAQETKSKRRNLCHFMTENSLLG